jgi:tetratricopeptide (TPR) repeat protein
MGKIIPFPGKQPSKFGFERARKIREENPDQLNLFSAKSGEVRRLPTNISAFEVALLQDERNDDRAAESYRRAISEGDRVADAYCNLGIIESRAGRTTKAFDCFTKSLEHNPRHLESHYNLGNLYFDVDNLRLARMHYEFAAEISNTSPNLYFNLGLVLALLDEKKGAIEALVKYQDLACPEEQRNVDDVICGLRKSLAASGQHPVP